MAQTFECPACGAGLSYSGGDDPVVTCSYCGKPVIVPDDLRTRQRGEPQPSSWAAMPFSRIPLEIDLGGLTGKVATLRSVRRLVHDGKMTEAMQVYQQGFGSRPDEARGVVERLAGGQSVVISNATFSQTLPVITSTQITVDEQAAQAIRLGLESVQQKQTKSHRRMSCVVLAVVISFVIILFVVISLILFFSLFSG